MKQVVRIIYLHDRDGTKVSFFATMDTLIARENMDKARNNHQFITTVVPLSNYNQELINEFSQCHKIVRDHIIEYGDL